ncbi:WhiB family transcriptional regulator [Streptomyces flaveolus]|uniref:WhiB family transcriptional regulator n=1 Tax=Streptomyces flaveolus TaxID=67297 RepID=A0ABV1VEU2_9ACTN
MPPTHCPDPDPRFPFPHSPVPTRCQKEPATFNFAVGDRSGESRAATEQRLAKARRVCSGCPIVEICLRWALVNKPHQGRYLRGHYPRPAHRTAQAHHGPART